MNMADLPWPVHFVAETLQLDAMRLGLAVGSAQIRKLRADWRVAVLDPVSSLLRRAGAEVDREHGRPIQLAAEREEFVGAERGWLDALPREVAHAWPLSARPDPVLPVIAGNEVAPGVTPDGHAERVQRCEHVAAKAVRSA